MCIHVNHPLDIEEFEVVVGGTEELLDPDRKHFYADTIKNELGGITGEKYPIAHEFGYIGKGAASEALIVAAPYIATAIAVFFSGKRIEENIDSWMRLTNRLKRFFIDKKRGADVYISLPAAKAYVLSLIANKNYDLFKLELLNQHIVPVNPMTEDTASVFKLNPERIYSFIMLINDEQVHYLGIKSNLEIIYHEMVDLSMLSF